MRASSLALACLVLGAVGVPGAAAADPPVRDTPGCVSVKEYRKVHDGQRKNRVHDIFDTFGRFGDGGAGGYSRVYRYCDDRRLSVIVEYGVSPRGVARVFSK